MAEKESADEKNTTVDAQQLADLNAKVGLNKLLMIAILVISSIVISVMATGMTVMYTRLNTLTASIQGTEVVSIEKQFQTLERQLLILADFRKSEKNKIAVYNQQLEKIASDCSADKISGYKAFLISREKDYQAMLSTLKSGSSNLASMSRGSREWLEPHHASLDQLKASSVERIQQLDAL